MKNTHQLSPAAQIVALLAAFVAPLGAQSLTVPTAYDASDAPSLALMAGITKRSRTQILIEAQHLVTLRGKTIDELWFRRDVNTDEVLEPGAANVRIVISETPVHPRSAARDFAANHGLVVQSVFDGTVSVSASPVITAASWSQDQTVRLVFQTPFPYSGQNLCIDCSSPQGMGCSSKWPIDAAYVNLGGSAVKIGAHCAGFWAPALSTLLADENSLAIGATARFSGFGRFGTSGYLLVGSLLGSNAIDLSAFGMTNCVLQVDPILTLTSAFLARWQGAPTEAPGATNFEIGIPYNLALLGGGFATQLMNLETGAQQSNPLGVTLSAALQVTLAATASPLGMAMVEGAPVNATDPLPAEGVVITNRAPVLRFVYH